MKNKINKDSLKYKIAVFVVYFIFVTALTVALVPLWKLLSGENGMENFRNILESYKSYSVIIFLLVQTVQVIVVLVPPVQIVGGMLFGGLFGSILSIVGVWIGSALTYWLVKTAGVPLVEAIISKKNIKKFGFLENTERVSMVLFVLYLIPGTPKDALTYLVPLTKIDIKQFLFVVLPARIPSIVISALLGSSIYKENYVATVIIAVVIVLFAVGGFIFKNKIIEKLKNFVKNKIDSKK